MKFLHALLAFCSFGLYISTTSAADETDTIIVTASRGSQTADETLASVSVITREQIEESQAQTVEDLLRGEAGLDVVRSGGALQPTSVFMRGTNSDHALVLIDGVRVNSATTGAFPWERLDLNQIERIEIVRGSRSSLYGSDAIGGVIQIFTRRSKKTGVEAMAGSFDTRGLSAVARMGSSDRWISLSASTRQAEGFSATNTNSFSYDPDADGYTQHGLSLTSGIALSRASRLSLFAMQTDSNSEYDAGTAESLNRVAGVKLETGRDDRWQQTVSYGYHHDYYLATSDITTTRNQFDWQHDIALQRDQRLLAGINYEDVRASNTGAPFSDAINNAAAFVAWQAGYGRHKFELSGRYDVHSDFGSQPTAQLAWGTQLNRDWRLRTGIGSAFKAPDLNELYHPGFDYSAFIPGCNPCYAGNPALQPETSRNIEIGLINHRGNMRNLLNLYYNDISNLIASQGTNFQSINVGHAITYGVELEHHRRFNIWDFMATATWQRARDEDTQTDLLRRPGSKYSLRLRRPLAGGKLTTEILGIGEYQDYGPITVAGHLLLNAAWQHRIGKDWVFGVRADNLADQVYQPVYGYTGTPRSFYVSLRWIPSAEM